MPDTEAPSAPTNLASPVQTATTIQLTWTASTDNVGINRYEVFRNSVMVYSGPSTSADDIGLNPSSNYVYTVRAVDMSNITGPSSAPLTVSTSGTPTASGTISRDLDLPSGIIAVTGLLFPPKAVLFFAGMGVANVAGSTGFATISGSGCLTNYNSGSVFSSGNAIELVTAVSPLWESYAIVSAWKFNGFELLWTKLGKPTGIAYVKYLALG